MPSEPPESSFASKVRQVAYPCQEPGRSRVGLDGTDRAAAAAHSSNGPSCRRATRSSPSGSRSANWFQALEGGIDSSHISFLHAPQNPRDAEVARELDRASFGVGEAVQTTDKAPRFEVVDTDYGALIGRASVVAGRAALLGASANSSCRFTRCRRRTATRR